MRDNSLILTDSAVAADAFAANALTINKTGHEGIWLMFHVTKTGADADERLDIRIFGKDTDAGWALTDPEVSHVPGQIGSGMVTNDTYRTYVRVQHKYKFMKPYYDVSGTTPGFTIVCSVVSGPQRETAA
jgi:hypothetical protein